MTDQQKVGDDEVVYRKIAVKFGWYDPIEREVKPDAFRPTKHDTDGLSVDRARSDAHPEFRSIELAAQGRQDEYYIAVLDVRELANHGFTILADPMPDNPGHALITDLTYLDRKSPESKNKMALLAHQLVDRVEGPFRSVIR